MGHAVSPLVDHLLDEHPHERDVVLRRLLQLDLDVHHGSMVWVTRRRLLSGKMSLGLGDGTQDRAEMQGALQAVPLAVGVSVES